MSGHASCSAVTTFASTGDLLTLPATAVDELANAAASRSFFASVLSRASTSFAT
jgi:hypothetical protein